ncbi:hypothetical protein NP233_g9816 [Leucocoprinus birnbaumii]|uniref:F-box domain-containing protein n=1 Tax=Leucocoprinus birnbaumii TaxID=56174 RepID=A0AAD5VJQ4_9AGAR|nr:hypothetical protein NP233_g9816 [Leucocoprinus birnbaumii]
MSSRDEIAQEVTLAGNGTAAGRHVLCARSQQPEHREQGRRLDELSRQSASSITQPFNGIDTSSQSRSDSQIGVRTEAKAKQLPLPDETNVQRKEENGEKRRKGEDYESWRREDQEERQRKAEKAVEELLKKVDLGAVYGSNKQTYVPKCNEGTRQSLLSRLVEWGHSSRPTHSLLWLSGPAAVGKSAVAQTVAEDLGKEELLGATFFFYQPYNRTTLDTVILTLVLQLSLLLPPYKLIVGQRFTEDPLIFDKTPRYLFEKLLTEPFIPDLSHRPLTYLSYLSYQLLISTDQRPLLIILDGLDECRDSNAECELVKMICDHAQQDSDSRLRWMICSRPETHLLVAFSSTITKGTCYQEKLEVDDGEAQKDSLCILRRGFAEIRERYPLQLPADWPDPAQVNYIADRASGHLGFVSFIIRFIGDHHYANPSGQLDVCLQFLQGANGTSNSNPLHALDLLYTQILSNIPSEDLPIVRLILGLSTLYGNERLTALVHANFLGLNRATFYRSLQRLYSVLFVPSPVAPEEAFHKHIRVYHASFSDYLKDPSRSGRFVIDDGEVHLYVATRGLNWLGHCLKKPSGDFQLSSARHHQLMLLTVQHLLPEPSWIPTTFQARTIIDSVCHFAFTPCWRSFSEVPEKHRDTLMTALRKFDFELNYSLWEHELPEFAYFTRWLLSSDTGSLVHIDPQAITLSGEPGKRAEIMIVWDEGDPRSFIRPFFRGSAVPADCCSIRFTLLTRTRVSFHLVLSTVIRDTTQLREDDIIVAVMGPPGSGKSYFIDLLCGRQAGGVNATPKSVKSDIQGTRVLHVNYGRRVVLLEIPSFDIATRSNLKILRQINDWLAKTYKYGIKLRGIIYLHRITDESMRGSPFMNLQIFGHICGDNAAASVVFVSTMWSKVFQNHGEARESELRRTFWRGFIERGSSIDRLRHNEGEEAWRIVNGMIESTAHKDAVLMQEEVVDLRRNLNETHAGKALYIFLRRIRCKQKNSLQSLLVQTKQSIDPDLTQELNEEYETIKQEIRLTDEEVHALKISICRRTLGFLFSSKRPKSHPEVYPRRTPLVTEQEIVGISQGKIIHNLNVPDLPPEIWAEILSYLPRGSVRKMIGINRMLFELGMDELYKEICLTDYEDAGLKTFQQIQYPNLASRVGGLVIRPTFLPGMNCKGKAIYDSNESRSQRRRRKKDIRTFLDTALDTLPHCTHMKKLSFVVHDQYMSKSLAKFMRQLLKRIGANLESLTIDLTLSSFLSIHQVFNPKFLPRISALVIKIIDSRYETSRSQARRARKALLSVIQPLNATLQILAFEVVNFNLSKIFQKLKKTTKSPLPRASSRSRVQHTHTHNPLRYIPKTQRRQPRTTGHPPTNSRYTKLLELRGYNRQVIQPPSLTTHVRTFVPHLKNLTLTGKRSTLDPVQLSLLLHGLGAGDSGLEFLKISVARFSPEHLELFSTSLPSLRRLDLSYSVLWMNNRSLMTQTGLDWDATIYEDFRTRTYPQWKLEEARIVQVDETIPTLRRVARTRDCECRW